MTSLSVSTDLQDRLEHYLLSESIVGAAATARALSAASETGGRLDQALLELGIIDGNTLETILSTALNVSSFSDEMFRREEAEAACAIGLEASFLRARKSVPIALTEAELSVGMVDPFDDFTAKAIALRTGRGVRRFRLTEVQVNTLLGNLFGGVDDIGPGPDTAVPSFADLDILRDAASDAPVIRYVQQLIRDAVLEGASDIHLRPGRSSAETFLRVNGSLRPIAPPASELLAGIISRLKILAGLDISERRLPQDGRIRTTAAGKPVELRLSTMPHINGEAAVLRVLDRDVGTTELAGLGFSTAVLRGLEMLFRNRSGLVLVTGPTGSGKTTTLYAALKQLIRPELNVITIEDPVEYRVDGAAQIQVDEKIGLTFSAVLRSLLRHDPNIILVGEIRDEETASSAVQAALTGNLVLSTLHTNSALSAIPRLIDMGVEPFLLAAVLRGVLAQRLLPRRCELCGGSDPRCSRCRGSGISGRVAAGEVAVLDPEIVTAAARSTRLSPELMARLESQFFRPLDDDVAERVARGEIVAEPVAAEYA